MIHLHLEVTQDKKHLALPTKGNHDRSIAFKVNLENPKKIQSRKVKVKSDSKIKVDHHKRRCNFMARQRSKRKLFQLHKKFKRKRDQPDSNIYHKNKKQRK